MFFRTHLLACTFVTHSITIITQHNNSNLWFSQKIITFIRNFFIEPWIINKYSTYHFFLSFIKFLHTTVVFTFFLLINYIYHSRWSDELIMIQQIFSTQKKNRQIATIIWWLNLWQMNYNFVERVSSIMNEKFPLEFCQLPCIILDRKSIKHF